MTFHKKALVARNRTTAQIAIKFVVGTFHKFFREVLKYELKFICSGGFDFWDHLKIKITN